MPDELTPLFVLVLAVTLAYFATPLAIRAADRFDFYDRPVGYKGHTRPTPYLGGSAVVGTFVLVVLLVATDSDRTLPLVAGVAILWLVGTIDDRRTVRPATRIALEISMAAGLWGLGHSWELGVGAGVDLLLTTAWIVGVVNAFNLFDNMDGATGTMAIVVSAGISILGLVIDDPWLAAAGAALCGACLGFLPHNLSSPAKIFLGDGGSMPIGFGVATLVMMGASSAAASWQALVIGILMVGIPALDTLLVIVSRVRRRIPLSTGGRDHLTHRARQRLQTVRAVMLALGAAQVVLAMLALVAARSGSVGLAAATFVYLVAVGAAIYVFDGRPGAPFPREGATLALPERGPASGSTSSPDRRLPAAAPRAVWNTGVVVLLGALIGISPFFEALYNSQDWAPAGIALVVALVAGLMARPFQPSTPVLLLVTAVGLLALLALFSGSWAPAPERAFLEANRIFLYLALLGLLLVAIRDDDAAIVGLGAATAGSLAVVGFLVFDMARGNGEHVFLAGRLDEPLGYINGQATVLVLTLFPLVALAERWRHPVLAGVAASLGAIVGGLMLLTQSRGAALAVLVALFLVLTLVPGRGWRVAAVAAITGGVAIVAPRLLDVLPASGTGDLAAAAESASRSLLIASLIVGVGWAGICAVYARASERTRPTLERGGAIALAAGCLLAAAIALPNSARIADRVGEQYDAFIRLEGSETTPSGSRLLSGGGNRYAYWRVAVDAWKVHPLRGLGAGSYPVAYFRERTITEDVRQPHSLQLQALAELGLAGLVLLLVAAVAVGIAIRHRLAAARSSPRRRALLVAALGMAVAWSIHTSIDWPHLLPGVTGFALIAVAVLLRPDRAASQPEPIRTSGRGWWQPAAVVVLAAVLAIAGFSLSRQVLTDYYRDQAEDALAAGRPAEAIEQADRALRLAPHGIEAYYAKAAAYARFNEPSSARDVLNEAVRREPSNFLTYALLGDLEVRVGDYEAAGRAYRAAAALNPRDPELARLAADPTSAGNALGR